MGDVTARLDAAFGIRVNPEIVVVIVPGHHKRPVIKQAEDIVGAAFVEFGRDGINGGVPRVHRFQFFDSDAFFNSDAETVYLFLL